MADEKMSCGDRSNMLYQCFECGWEEVVMSTEVWIDGRVCDECGGHSSFSRMTNLKRISNESKKKTVGQIKVDIDCSDALTGLKAVQREAKKATAALRELEEQQKKISREEMLANLGIQVVDRNGNKISSKHIEEQYNNLIKFNGLVGDQS